MIVNSIKFITPTLVTQFSKLHLEAKEIIIESQISKTFGSINILQVK